MPLLPNIDALLTTSQRCYADALDLVELCVEARLTGDVDEIAVHIVRQRIGDAPGYALAQTVAFQAGLLSAAAVAMAELGGATPDEILADWRRMAGDTIALAEAQLQAFMPTGGETP
jgi:hypothetical protein